MRLAAISDVHANLSALEAVLRDIKRRGIKEKIFIGDAVGYGPDPDEATRLLKNECRAFVAGNHDWAVLGLTDIERFNPSARAAIRWTDDNISAETRETLQAWPIVKVLKKEDMLLVHSTPEAPEEWGYLFSAAQAAPMFNFFKQTFCIVGHSHQPFIAELTADGRVVEHTGVAEVKKSSRYIINGGSVGQPRDRDPRAAYAVFDDGRVEVVRVEYDIPATQERMRRAGLPAPLAERLGVGM